MVARDLCEAEGGGFACSAVESDHALKGTGERGQARITSRQPVTGKNPFFCPVVRRLLAEGLGFFVDRPPAYSMTS
jgi:hypothetical protein